MPVTDDRLRYDYAAANPRDEIAWLFPMFDAATVTIWPRRGRDGRLSRFNADAGEVHHIAGGMHGASRDDYVTNLIHLHPLVHEWCERYRDEGLAMCFAVKTLKHEWDDRIMHQVCGVPVMREYLTTRVFQFPWVAASLEHCERMAA